MITTIGIDYSLNSTGICIKIGNVIKFVNITAKRTKTHKKLSCCTTFEIKPHIDKTQFSAMYRVKMISDAIIDVIKPIVNKDTEIFIEGFSYASKGQSFIDLIMGQSFLRYAIIDQFQIYPNIIPPAQLKKHFSGKGNADKVEMLNFFIKNYKNQLAKEIKEIEKENEIISSNGKKVVGPISDLIDAFALTLCPPIPDDF